MKTAKNILLGIGFALLERLISNIMGGLLGLFVGISVGIYAVAHGLDADTLAEHDWVLFLAIVLALPFEYLFIQYLLKKWNRKFDLTVFVTFYVMLGLMTWVLLLVGKAWMGLVVMVIMLVVYGLIQPLYLQPKSAPVKSKARK